MNNLKFYVIATPIGNLKDITLRALETLEIVDELLCEDTRKTLNLLNHYNIKKKLICYNEHTKHKITKNIITSIKNGKIYGLVTDAGTPLISDPGYYLIKELIAEKVKVIPIPGASALTTALSASGLNTDIFLFIGFLSNNHKKTRELFEQYAKLDTTIIFFEAANRLTDTLHIALDIFGDRQIAICRELTKLYEEFIRGTIAEILKNKNIIFKGEIVVVIDNRQNDKNNFVIDQKIEKLYNYLFNKNLEKTEILKIISDIFGIKKNILYDYFIKNRKI